MTMRCGILTILMAALALAGPIPAAAQGLFVPVPPVDAARIRSEVDARLAQTMPPVCTSPPAMDTLTGTAGTAAPCTPRIDAASQTVIQAKNTTTAADATWQVTFDMPFASVPIWADAQVYGQAQPYICTVTALSTTGASGKCFQVVPTTLPAAALALLNLVVSPVAPAGAGISVRVVVRQ